MRTIALTLLLALSAFAQQGSGPDNGGITRGNFLRKPDYATPGTGVQTYYVDASTGSDSFNCQVSTTPCATIQGALNKVPKLLRDQVTVSVAAGNYAGFIISGLDDDNGVQQTTGGLLIDGALVNSTLATGSATGTAAGAGQSAGSGSTFGTLCDSGATWTVNDLRGRFVTTTLPTNTNLVISSNTATCLTVVGTWSLPVAAQTTYAIQDPSVIITSAVSQPATPINAVTANRAAIEILGNTVNYRTNALVIRNIRLANTLGQGVDVNDLSNVRLTAMQIRPSAATANGVIIGVGVQAAGNVTVANCDVSLGTSNNGVSVNGGGVLTLSNTLVRNSATTGTALLIGSGNGAYGQLQNFNASELLNFLNGMSLVCDATSTSQLTGNRITCGTGSGIGVALGSATTTAVGCPSAAASLTNFNITTCGTGLQVVGPAAADVTSMTGAAATTGFSALLGGLIAFGKAGVTMTAGTNEINLDSGGLTANFADVTAASCVATAPQSSRVCGR